MQRHRHQEFIPERYGNTAFSLNAIEAKMPAGKVVHVILDNYATHKHPKVMAWLTRHPFFFKLPQLMMQAVERPKTWVFRSHG